MKTYTVERASGAVPLTGDSTGTPWETSAVARLDEFNWYESGPRWPATVRALYDESALYLQFHVEDHDISASVTELNGPTYKDSCVEFFATPSAAHPDQYFNFEANCCGTFKLAWQERDWQERGLDRELITEDAASDVSVVTSEPGSTREPDPSDDAWWLAVALPFDILETLTGRPMSPEPGTVWRGNFHRTGVSSPSREVSWNPIETPSPTYHSPEHFGRLRFV
ncbi:MAG: carbohydrate-binding family 9-like protein [Haloplanus sp.]